MCFLEVTKMANITFSVPDDLKKEMEKHPEINWSEVARSAIRQKVADLKFLAVFKAKSKITEEDAEELGRKVSEYLAQHYLVKK